MVLLSKHRVTHIKVIKDLNIIIEQTGSKCSIAKINPMHDKFVEPSKKYADIILDEDYDFKLIKNKIDQLLYGNLQKN